MLSKKSSKVENKSKSSEEGSSSSSSNDACFGSESQAAALANQLLAELWVDVLDTDCDVDTIVHVYGEYLTNDIDLVAFGKVIADSLDGVTNLRWWEIPITEVIQV